MVKQNSWYVLPLSWFYADIGHYYGVTSIVYSIVTSEVCCFDLSGQWVDTHCAYGPVHLVMYNRYSLLLNIHRLVDVLLCCCTNPTVYYNCH